MNCSKDRDQKKINKMSVETKKDDKDTAGIKKKAVDVKIAKSLLWINFFEIKKITNADTQ